MKEMGRCEGLGLRDLHHQDLHHHHQGIGSFCTRQKTAVVAPFWIGAVFVGFLGTISLLWWTLYQLIHG